MTSGPGGPCLKQPNFGCGWGCKRRAECKIRRESIMAINEHKSGRFGSLEMLFKEFPTYRHRSSVIVFATVKSGFKSIAADILGPIPLFAMQSTAHPV